jgi:hypothetical protein
MAKLTQLVVDCPHPAPLARFWAAALDGFELLPYDDDEIARLAALGLTPETDPVVILAGPGGLELCFQQVDVADLEKRPMHMDVSTPDRPAEVRRLLDLGATVRQEHDGHTWMLDPAGNDFCVVDERDAR